MKKRLPLVLGIPLLLLLWGSPGLGQSSNDLTKLTKEIEALREGQKALQSDIQEIKNLLRARQALPAQPQGPQDTLPQEVVLSIAGAPSLGSKAAKVTLVEFSDFQCPFCARHYQQTLPEIVKEYVDTGKVNYVMRDFPMQSLHPQAHKSHEAAHCAGEQAKYWEMHHRLFGNIRGQGAAELAAHAKALGLDVAKFEQCVKSEKYAAKVRQGIEDAGRAGVRGTPTFFVGVTDASGQTVKATRVVRGAHPYQSFKQVIDSLLAEAN